MTQFDAREKAFEKKFSLDEEARFRNTVRAVKLFGLWIAAQMGLSDGDAEGYAVQLTELTVSKGGHPVLIEKAGRDLEAKGVALSARYLEKELTSLEGKVSSGAYA